MKVIVVHTSKGKINSLSIPSSHFSGLGIKPPHGHHVSIVEIGEVEHAGHLAKYLDGHRIETRGDRPKLVKK